MEQVNSKTQKSNLKLSGLWLKVPLVVRAVIVGFTVNTIGVGSWVLAISFVPFPWSIILMAVLLWIYIKYFSGSWGSARGRKTRSLNFRVTKLSSKIIGWGLIGAGLFVLTVQSGLVVTFRILEFPDELFKAEYNLDSMPVWAAWIGLIMASAVAGICEETGFRGYMQAPLERKYGPVAAITIVSVVFVLVHLHQAWAWPILFQIFGASVLFGMLAYSSGSLIPGIVAHFVLDIFNFSYWWSDLLGSFQRMPIGQTGIDVHFLTWTLVFLVGLGLFILNNKKLNDLRNGRVVSSL